MNGCSLRSDNSFLNDLLEFKQIRRWMQTQRSIQQSYLRTSLFPSALDGDWSTWLAWTPCPSGNCRANQTRRRRCDDPFPAGEGKDCPGSDLDEKECCPKGRKIGSWTSSYPITVQLEVNNYSSCYGMVLLFSEICVIHSPTQVVLSCAHGKKI